MVPNSGVPEGWATARTKRRIVRKGIHVNKTKNINATSRQPENTGRGSTGDSKRDATKNERKATKAGSAGSTTSATSRPVRRCDGIYWPMEAKHE